MSLPSNVCPILTDFYQLSMVYAFWKSGNHLKPSIFDLYYRKPPFGGSFIVFAGLDECIQFLSSFSFGDTHIDYIATLLHDVEPNFLIWLQSINCCSVKLHAQRQGSIAFPGVPLLRVSGPLGVVQLLETTLLNLVNYASLVATNAHRFRMAAGENAKLFEFGLRRAQGPNGALTASKYCYLGGFDGTSNVAAGFKFGIPVKGTHAHSFVQSYISLEDLKQISVSIPVPGGTKVPFDSFKRRVLNIRDALDNAHVTCDGELAAFISYAAVYPSGFSALVDTYSTLKSGVPNFMFVALALCEIGCNAKGVRLDSGDLASLSTKAHKSIHSLASLYKQICSDPCEPMDMVENLVIMASNNVTVPSILEMRKKGHKIGAFGIGTHLVTCKEQSSLGSVFKLAVIGSTPRMKLSEEVDKASIPGAKTAYRIFGQDGKATCDLLTLQSEKPPSPGNPCICKDRSNPMQTYTIVPKRVAIILFPILHGHGQPAADSGSCLELLNSAKMTLATDISLLRSCHYQLVKGQDEYRVFLSKALFQTLQSTRAESFAEITE